MHVHCMLLPPPPRAAANERQRRWLKLELEALTLLAFLLGKRGQPGAFDDEGAGLKRRKVRCGGRS